MTDTQRLDVFQRRLIGNAHVWYESLVPTLITYDETKGLFRQLFCSHTTQRKIRNEIVRAYQCRSSNGIVNHAIIWIAKVKYLFGPVDPTDLINIIIQHYPSALGIAIVDYVLLTNYELF